jgi:hypothetical protein
VSWQVTRRVQKTRVGSPSAKAVLLALANFSNDRGESCFPSQRLIADITELSLDTIQRQIRFLIEKGFLRAQKERRKGHWESWSYTINLAALADQTAPCGTVNQAANCGTVKEDQAAPRGVAKPQSAARPSRTLRPYPSNHPFNQSAEEALASATRIPENFKPGEENYAWAVSQLGSTAAADRSLARFRDHNRQVAGARSLSRDWDARFRLWVDGDAERASEGQRSKTLSQTTFDGERSALPAEHHAGNTVPDAHWSQLLKTYVNIGIWTKHVAVFGGEPGSPSCRVPQHLLVEYGLVEGTP